MFIVKNRLLFFIIAAVLLIASFVAVFVRGLNVGIDFTGGSVLEVTYDTESMPGIEDIHSLVPDAESIRQVGDNGYSIRSTFISDEERVALVEKFKAQNETVEVKKFSSIGPAVGKELRNKSIAGIIILLVATIIYVAISFRKVSEPISSWWYGFTAILALIHDIIIPIGVFALFGFEVDILFVTALLAILGFSINDTIVVFDRIREQLKDNKSAHRDESFEHVVGMSLRQTMARSINTTLTVLVALVVLLVLGGEVVRSFILALTIGVLAGSYSSIFLASPFLVSVAKRLGKI